MLTTTNTLRLIFALPMAIMVTAASADQTSAQRPERLPVAPASEPMRIGVSEFQRNMYHQVFRDAKQCLESISRIEQLHNNVVICESAVYGKGPPQQCSNRKRQLDAALQSAQSQPNFAGCSKDPKVSQVRFGDAVVKAASAGDIDAQVCYVEGQWTTSTGSEHALYKRKANKYMKHALSHGDWRIVQLLATPAESIVHGGVGKLAGFSTIGAPFTVYRANRLLEFGATGGYLSIVRTQARSAIASLTPAQIENADAWARSEFKRNFVHSPKLTSAPVPCVNHSSTLP
jgi:hypothetical protein